MLVKDLGLLSFITQLGMSVAAPLAGFTLLGVWLKNRFGLGVWIVLVLMAVGLISAASGFMTTLKTLEKRESRKDKPASDSFNEHK